MVFLDVVVGIVLVIMILLVFVFFEIILKILGVNYWWGLIFIVSISFIWLVVILKFFVWFVDIFMCFLGCNYDEVYYIC